MKIKKYIAATMPEAMQKIRADLGPDAVILNSKEIKQKGFLGLFKQNKIEVVAALDPQPIYKTKQVDKVIPKPPLTAPVENKGANEAVLDEIKHLKKMIEQQTRNTPTLYSVDYQLAYDYLLEQEVTETLAKELIDAVIEQHQLDELPVTDKEVMQDIQVEIEKRLAATHFSGITYEQKVIHFVGPTGVGKTTTLAKVAAESMLKDQKKVAFITSDTYRIAAIDQLKTYARILDVPVEVAYTTDDYHRAIAKFADYDLILVDTAGRNYRDEKYVRELLSEVDTNIKTYLVLSLTAKPKDIIDIYKQFSHLPIKEVIFTKLDETTQYGSILNIALAHDVGIAYLTNGQDVPEDLVRPTKKLISDYVISGYYDE